MALRAPNTTNTIIGTVNDDNLYGLANVNDLILGLQGNDFLKGRSGNDILNGGSGEDTLIGSLGDDWLIVGGDGIGGIGGAGDLDVARGGGGYRHPLAGKRSFWRQHRPQ
ncbi:MAG: hypothetical protein AcusKO_29130 [Acuticoccus sp.]